MRVWLALCFLPLPVLADTAEDKGYLTSWLEENLSGAGRTVTIDGFQGALSSTASLTQMTIADDKGVWLTLKDVKLDWSRSALFSGQIQINELSAGEIDLERVPDRAPASSLPAAEAKPFALPDLPVSVSIAGIAAHRIVLGESVLGQPVEGSLTADLTLSGGEGAAHLDLLRGGDGPKGHVTLAASYSNASQILSLALDAGEDKGGIAASLLHVPGAPATSLKVDGTGPLTDFAAKIDLATDGVSRLAGQVATQVDAAGNRSFTADLGGDPTPVFLPDYAEFFGPDVKLSVKGLQAATGALKLDALHVEAKALTLDGAVSLDAAGRPQVIALTGKLGLPDGPVVLPVGTDQPIRVGGADLALAFDAAKSADWTLDATLSGLDSSSVKAGSVAVRAAGQLQDAVFAGRAEFQAGGLQPTDPGLAAALGDAVQGSAQFSWNRTDKGFQVSDLQVAGAGYAVTTKGVLAGMGDLTGTVSGHYDDLSKLALLAGKPLAGAATFDLSGSGNPLSGAFDVEGKVQGQGLALGVAEVDGLLKGASSVEISARRDETGTLLRKLTVQAASLAAHLSGKLAAAGSSVTGDVSFADLSQLGAGYRGGMSATGSFEGTLAAGKLVAEVTGQDIAIGQAQADGLLKGASTISLETTFADGVARLQRAEVVTPQGKVALTGTLSQAASDVVATLALPDLAPLGADFKGAVAGTASFKGATSDGVVTVEVTGRNLGMGQPQADALLRGDAKVSAKLSLTGAGLRVDQAQVATSAVTANVTGLVDGANRNLTIAARLANLAVLYPQFPGALTVNGTAVQGDSGTALDLVVKGPGQIDAKIAGNLSADYSRGDIGISGSATAALANALIAPRSVDGALRFDLRLKGPLALASLSGPVTVSGGRLADPSLTFALTDIRATARLGGGRVQLDAASALTTGGGVTVGGSLGLAAPYLADLKITAQNAVLKDPQLYTTTANGTLSFKGPAMGGARIAGAISLGKTELRIPSTGMGADGGLPGLKHRGDSADVRATRARAGADGAGSGGNSGPGYGLDLTINAPNQVFIRGRGLDAELGGSLVLRGSTAAIAPSGAFNLIRGRLDILGHRLVLSEAQFTLQGALVPYMHVIASVQGEDVTSIVQIEGDATNPVISFTSTPELPQEEVLAHLLFNKSLANISAFQAAQLASAVGTLAGRGGDGVLGALRRKTGLDNLDVQADAAGNTSVTAGKYLSEKTYSEVTVDQAGKSTISLNYDVTRHITLKAKVETEGNTSVGVYLKRDY